MVFWFFVCYHRTVSLMARITMAAIGASIGAAVAQTSGGCSPMQVRFPASGESQVALPWGKWRLQGPRIGRPTTGGVCHRGQPRAGGPRGKGARRQRRRGCGGHSGCRRVYCVVCCCWRQGREREFKRENPKRGTLRKEAGEGSMSRSLTAQMAARPGPASLLLDALWLLPICLRAPRRRPPPLAVLY